MSHVVALRVTRPEVPRQRRGGHHSSIDSNCLHGEHGHWLLSNASLVDSEHHEHDIVPFIRAFLDL